MRLTLEPLCARASGSKAPVVSFKTLRLPFRRNHNEGPGK